MNAGIVGAGIMGQLLALELYKAGWQVSVFEKDDGLQNCSQAAAGLLAPYSELDRSNIEIYALGHASVQNLWPQILQQIPEPIYFQATGSLVLTHPQDQAEWHVFSRRIASQLKEDTNFVEQLSQKDLRALEPGLGKFSSGYYFPYEAHIDCQSLLVGLSNYLQQQGVFYRMNTLVLSIKSNQIITMEKNYSFDKVFDCRGLAAKEEFTDLRGVRGELIWLHAPEVKLTRAVRLLHPRYSVYLVPRPGNIYIIGASEIEAEEYSNISVRTTLELLTAAYFVHAGFIEARVVKMLTHCRPTLADHQPCIKKSKDMIAVNGLYRHGFLIAPALAAEIVQALQNDFQHLNYPNLWEEVYA